MATRASRHSTVKRFLARSFVRTVARQAAYRRAISKLQWLTSDKPHSSYSTEKLARTLTIVDPDQPEFKRFLQCLAEAKHRKEIANNYSALVLNQRFHVYGGFAAEFGSRRAGKDLTPSLLSSNLWQWKISPKQFGSTKNHNSTTFAHHNEGHRRPGNHHPVYGRLDRQQALRIEVLACMNTSVEFKFNKDANISQKKELRLKSTRASTFKRPLLRHGLQPR